MELSEENTLVGKHSIQNEDAETSVKKQKQDEKVENEIMGFVKDIKVSPLMSFLFSIYTKMQGKSLILHIRNMMAKMKSIRT